MFTGIVEELGEVIGIDDLGDAARLTVRGPQVTGDVAGGDSIAVNGVCLTVSGHTKGTFTADVMRETLARSSLGALTPGAAVNLERSVRLEIVSVATSSRATSTARARSCPVAGGALGCGARRAVAGPVPLRG